MFQNLKTGLLRTLVTLMVVLVTVNMLYAQTSETPPRTLADERSVEQEIISFADSAYKQPSTDSLSITIIESQSINSGHDMDDEWSSLVTQMGHSPSIMPQTTLDSTGFFSTTDILIISSGVIDIPTNRRNIIMQFIQQGGSVYISSEYLSSYQSNATFMSIVNSLGGSFSWGSTTSGDLQPINILGTLSNTPKNVSSLDYFWYGCTGNGDATIEKFLDKNGQFYGFIFSPPNSIYGDVITTSDQDWVRQRGTDDSDLMWNIITRLATAPAQSCTLDVDVRYTGDTLNMDFTVGLLSPATWNVFLSVADVAVPLLSIPLPAIDPPLSLSIPIPGFPDFGGIGILTTLTTPTGGIICSDWSTAGRCNLGTDSDNDRLDDCYETNTGVYVSPTNTGTDPSNPDTDGDNINDGDEVLGTLSNLDLPGMGANPLRKDLFIEYDWFTDSLDCANHSHRPSVAAVNMVAQAFANSPVSNPDGSTGITFHNDRGQGGVFTGGNLINDADGVLTGGVNSAEFMSHKTANFASNRNGYFHYCILPHRYNTSSGSSGQAELPGDDLIVSLQCFNSDGNVSHTIMHEFGHNLNLRHGGNVNCNYKPNYNSVMNYRYQFPGVDNNCSPPADGILNYSIGDRIVLNENNLNENNGICGAPPWDWNGNTTIENGVTFDINGQDTNQGSNCSGTLTTLSDYNDWANLSLTGLQDADGRGFLRSPPEIIDCDNPAPDN